MWVMQRNSSKECSPLCGLRKGDKMKRKKSPLEEHFKIICLAEGLTNFEREYKFHPTRKWKIDFYFPEYKLAVECDGGIWLGGRGGHSSGQGISRDKEKANAMTMMGIALLQYTNKREIDKFPSDLDKYLKTKGLTR